MNRNDTNNEELDLFIEELEQQLVDLNQISQRIPFNASEAKRLIHAIEGAAGVMEMETLRQVVQRMGIQLERSSNASSDLHRYVQVLHGSTARLRASEPLESIATMLQQAGIRGVTG